MLPVCTRFFSQNNEGGKKKKKNEENAQTVTSLLPAHSQNLNAQKVDQSTQNQESLRSDYKHRIAVPTPPCQLRRRRNQNSKTSQNASPNERMNLPQGCRAHGLRNQNGRGPAVHASQSDHQPSIIDCKRQVMKKEAFLYCGMAELLPIMVGNTPASPL
jgi:hypothetical protein